MSRGLLTWALAAAIVGVVPGDERAPGWRGQLGERVEARVHGREVGDHEERPVGVELVVEVQGVGGQHRLALLAGDHRDGRCFLK